MWLTGWTKISRKWWISDAWVTPILFSRYWCKAAILRLTHLFCQIFTFHHGKLKKKTQKNSKFMKELFITGHRSPLGTQQLRKYRLRWMIFSKSPRKRNQIECRQKRFIRKLQKLYIKRKTNCQRLRREISGKTLSFFEVQNRVGSSCTANRPIHPSNEA